MHSLASSPSSSCFTPDCSHTSLQQQQQRQQSYVSCQHIQSNPYRMNLLHHCEPELSNRMMQLNAFKANYTKLLAEFLPLLQQML
jgi:hypothetical protein